MATATATATASILQIRICISVPQSPFEKCEAQINATQKSTFGRHFDRGTEGRVEVAFEKLSMQL